MIALCTASAFAQSGGGYLIKKSTIDSGGYTYHTGGGYKLGGTVGQHDAGPLSGGGYLLTGGFWSPAAMGTPPPSPTPDPSGIDKCRFVSFSVPNSGGETALRVRLTSLHHVNPPYTGGTSTPFTGFEGQAMYVGPPAQYVESVSSGTPFYASRLQCAPDYRDWSTVGLLRVTGEAIVPSSNYDVQNLAASCAGNEASCTAVSAPLSISTTRWGDVIDPFNPPSPTTQPDTGDFSALVNKFKSALGAPIKARALLAGENQRGLIGDATLSVDLGFTHISLCVDAFKGLPYPYRPGKCTGNATKACATDADCTAQSVAGPCILCP